MLRETIEAYLMQSRLKTIDSYEVAALFSTEQRIVRKVLSKLRGNLTLITFPLHEKGTKGIYKVFEPKEPKDQAMLLKHVETQLKSFKSIYFNNIVKFKPIVRDIKMISQLNQIELALKGEEE